MIEVQTSSGFKHQIFQYDGNNYGVELAKMGFMPDPRVNNKAIKDMDIRKDDVIICAFPKCGKSGIIKYNLLLVKNHCNLMIKRPEYITTSGYCFFTWTIVLENYLLSKK